MFTERVYTLDRIEGESAILNDDAGVSATVPARALPPGVREGIVLQVPLGTGGKPLWARARVDHAETARRLAEAEDRLTRLKKRDPGGDVAL
jgi:hypothetical protein